MIKIMNCDKTRLCYEYDFRIDRSSPVGNPFPLQFEKSRNFVCDEYDKYFDDIMETQRNNVFFQYINFLIEKYNQHGKLRLFCWCAPKRCHGETIKKYIESL